MLSAAMLISSPSTTSLQFEQAFSLCCFFPWLQVGNSLFRSLIKCNVKTMSDGLSAANTPTAPAMNLYATAQCN